MTARWEESLDALLDLYLLMQSDRGKSYVAGWASSFTSKGGTIARALATRLDERIATVAINADAFWVDPDMMSLWEAAVPGFAAETLHPADLLAQTGFVYLPRPFMFTDTHGRRTCFRALAWHETTYEATNTTTGKSYTGHGIVVMTFHQVGDADDYDTGRGFPDNVGYVERSEAWRRSVVDGVVPYAATGSRIGDLQIDHVMPWEYGLTDTGSTMSDDNADPVSFLRDGKVLPDYKLDARHPQNVQRPVQALWRLMQQTIATRDATDASRPVRRRAQRAAFPEKRITVIRLRRPHTPPSQPAGDRTVDWTHRWFVSGHWRWQPYKDGIRRQIWISPYIKGPDDKPLEVRRVRVFELVR